MPIKNVNNNAAGAAELVFVPGYSDVAGTTLTSSGTVVSGVSGSAIVIEYHTAQNLGTADVTLAMRAGSTTFNTVYLPYTPGQNFAAYVTSIPGREWRLTAGSAFIVNMTGSGSVLTNTRYWYESA